jgi:hypothetical protein
MSRREKKRLFRLTCKRLLDQTCNISNSSPIASLIEEENNEINEILETNIFIPSSILEESIIELPSLPMKSIPVNEIISKPIIVLVIVAGDISSIKYGIWKEKFPNCCNNNNLNLIFSSDLSELIEQNNNSSNNMKCNKNKNNKKKSKNNNGVYINPSIPLTYPTSITHILVESNIYDKLSASSLNKLNELCNIYPNIYYGDGEDIKEIDTCKDLIKVVSQEWIFACISGNKIAKEKDYYNYYMNWKSSPSMIFESNEILHPLPKRPEKKDYVVDKTKFMCFNSNLIEEVKDSKSRDNKFPINKILSDLFFEYSLLVEQRNEKNDMFRKRAFARASNSIKDLLFEISLDNMNRLRRLIYPKYLNENKKDKKIFGERVIKRIQEYFDSNGIIAEFNRLKEDPIMLARVQLTRVWGIGPVKAREIMNNHNIYSIEHLREFVKGSPKLLNDQQIIGRIIVL